MKEYTKNLGKIVMTPKGAWSIKEEYEILDIVHDVVTDHAYISKQEVPSGVDLSDSRYWMPLNVSGYSDSNVITLNSFNEDGEIQSYTLEEAIKTIKGVGRKSGAILIFYNNNVNRLDITTGCWEIWQFNSINVYEWENLDAWVNIYYNYNKFVGWYAAENTLNIEIPNPDVGCYAFVGNIYNEAFVYRCDVKNIWTKTNQKAQHYIKVVFGNNVNIGTNGNWWQNGIDTNVPVSIKGDNGLTPYLRWSANNQIEYSYNNINWHPLSNRFSTKIKIKDYVSSIDELPNNVDLGTIYGVGPIYSEDDTEQTNPIYNIYVYTSNGWINNGGFNSISVVIVQELGDSETKIISQKTVTEYLKKFDDLYNFSLEENISLNIDNHFIYINDGSLTKDEVNAGINYTSEFLLIHNSIDYIIESLTYGYSQAAFAIYNNNKEFIKSYPSSYIDDSIIINNKKVSDLIEIPDNAKYIRFSSSGDYNIRRIYLSKVINDIKNDIKKLEASVDIIDNSLKTPIGIKHPIDFNYTTNRLLNSDGTEQYSDNGDWLVSNYINVTSNIYYKIKSCAIGGFCFICFYNNDKVLISNIQSAYNYDLQIFDDYIFIPDDVKYIKIAGSNELKPEIHTVNMSISTDDNWNNLKWAAIGDSLTEKNFRASKNYCDYIVDKTHINLINLGIGGTGYRNSMPFYTRVLDIPEDVDLITIFGSGNDLNRNYELGSITDIDTNTICGSINKVITEIQNKFPLVPFGIITPTPWQNCEPHEPNNPFIEYVKAIVEICNLRGVPCLDLYHCSNLHPSDEQFRKIAYSKDDGNGVHPDKNGHKIIYPRIFNFIKSLI